MFTLDPLMGFLQHVSVPSAAKRISEELTRLLPHLRVQTTWNNVHVTSAHVLFHRDVPTHLVTAPRVRPEWPDKCRPRNAFSFVRQQAFWSAERCATSLDDHKSPAIRTECSVVSCRGTSSLIQSQRCGYVWGRCFQHPLGLDVHCLRPPSAREKSKPKIGYLGTREAPLYVSCDGIERSSRCLSHVIDLAKNNARPIFDPQLTTSDVHRTCSHAVHSDGDAHIVPIFVL